MIISASYRTDIPALYGPWFMNRLDEGYCDVSNPYGGKPNRVSLLSEDVDGIVFWTKNINPFIHVLDELYVRDYSFVVQFSITGYPKQLESSVPATDMAVRAFRAVADRFGPRAVVWRYDPILDSDVTPFSWHFDNFSVLASALKDATDEAVISFAHFYRKTYLNLRKSKISWRDPVPEEKIARAARLAVLAAENGMNLTLCSQPDFIAPGVGVARCIDADRLSDVAGTAIVARLKGNRPGCGCYESRDIGAYDSCALGCVYCYAVRDRSRAKEQRRRHNPQGSFLISPERKNTV